MKLKLAVYFLPAVLTSYAGLYSKTEKFVGHCHQIKKDVGPIKVNGSASFSKVQATGHLEVNGNFSATKSTFQEPLDINGNISAKDCNFKKEIEVISLNAERSEFLGTITASGSVTFSDCKLKKDLECSVSITGLDSSFENIKVVNVRFLSFEDCNVKKITVSFPDKMPETEIVKIVLKGNSSVESIEVLGSNKNTEIILEDESQVSGEVINAKIVPTK